MRSSLNSIAFTNNFSWRQRLVIKLSESIADAHRCVQVNKELKTCRKYISPHQALCIEMICVVLLRLVGSQAISNAKVCFSSLSLKCARKRAQRGKGMTHPLHSAPLRDTHMPSHRESRRRERKKESRGETTHLLSIRRLSWSLRLDLYIELVPTDWETQASFLGEKKKQCMGIKM